MGGIRNNDLRPFLIPAALVPGTNQQKSREFAVGAAAGWNVMLSIPVISQNISSEVFRTSKAP